MSLPNPFTRRPDLSDASRAFAPPPAPAADGLANLLQAAGGTVDSRITRWVGYGLAAAGLGVGVYDMVSPHVLAAAFLLTLPVALLALVIGSPASFEVTSRRAGQTRSINGILVLPFVIMFLPNFEHAQIQPFAPLIPAAVAAAVIAPLAWLARSRPGVASPTTLVVFLLGCAAAYGYAATAMIDIQFDASPGAVVQVQVLSKHESHGRSTSYYLTLAPWGPRPRPNSVQVSRGIYRGLNSGDTACITLHPGAVNLAWFTAGFCAPPVAPAA